MYPCSETVLPDGTRSTVLLRYLAGISTQNISRTNISRISQPTPKISQPKISQAQKNISSLAKNISSFSENISRISQHYKISQENISTFTNISRISQENISRLTNISRNISTIEISQEKYLKRNKYLKEISQAYNTTNISRKYLKLIKYLKTIKYLKRRKYLKLIKYLKRGKCHKNLGPETTFRSRYRR